MNKASKKRKIVLREYKKVRDEYFAEVAKDQGREGSPPLCEVCLVYVATENHHRVGRTGQYLTDKRFFLATCEDHHRLITNNPAWAIKCGWTILRGDPDRMLEDARDMKREMEAGR